MEIRSATQVHQSDGKPLRIICNIMKSDQIRQIPGLGITSDPVVESDNWETWSLSIVSNTH
jgi:hypothetical protein